MYRILIVDDEPIVRRGIKKSVNWNELDIEMVAEAENGVEALEQVISSQPDIILLDICMPRMDGLEFASIVKKKYPQIRIVIITGFHDFEYARTALRMGIDDYILKPITKEDVVRIIKEQLEKIEKNAPIQNLGNDNKIKADILNGLLKKEVRAEAKIPKLCAAMGIGAEHPVTFVVMSDYIMGCALWEEEGMDELASFAVLNIASEILEMRGAGFAFETYKNEMALVLLCAREEIKSVLNDVYQNILDFIEIPVDFAVSDADEMKNLRTMSEQARRAMDCKFVLPHQNIIYFRDIENRTGSIFAYPIEVERELLDKIFMLEPEKSEETVGKFFENMQNIDSAQCKDAILRLMIKISHAIEAVNNRNIGDHEYANFDPMKQMQKFASVQDAKNWLVMLYNSAYEYISKIKSRSGQLYMKIIQYIQNNYADSDLNLKKCSEDLYLSSSYISMILKKESSKTFVDYLNEYRIEMAAEMLKNPESKIYEVATGTGFTHPTYFSSVFKKIKGVTPKQYKEIH
ncbi:MAG: response regulator [Christensenellaceae bacterium]